MATTYQFDTASYWGSSIYSDGVRNQMCTRINIEPIENPALFDTLEADGYTVEIHGITAVYGTYNTLTGWRIPPQSGSNPVIGMVQIFGNRYLRIWYKDAGENYNASEQSVTVKIIDGSTTIYQIDITSTLSVEGSSDYLTLANTVGDAVAAYADDGFTEFVAGSPPPDPTSPPPIVLVSGSNFWNTASGKRVSYKKQQEPAGITYTLEAPITRPTRLLYQYSDTSFISPDSINAYVSPDAITYTSSPSLGFYVDITPYSPRGYTARLGNELCFYGNLNTTNTFVFITYNGSSYTTTPVPAEANGGGQFASNGSVLISPSGQRKTGWTRYDGATLEAFDPEPLNETWPDGAFDPVYESIGHINGKFVCIPFFSQTGTYSAAVSSDGYTWTYDPNFLPAGEPAYYCDFIPGPTISVIMHGSYNNTFYTYDGTNAVFRTLPAVIEVGQFQRDLKIMYDKYRQNFIILHVRAGSVLQIITTTDFETYSELVEIESPAPYYDLLNSHVTPDGVALWTNNDGALLRITGANV